MAASVADTDGTRQGWSSHGRLVMQPLATAEDVLRSVREIEKSIFHGSTIPYDLIDL